MGEKIIVKNKKAYFDYGILETLEAGLKLTGAEVKSIKISRVNLKGSYIMIRGNEAFIENMHVSAYQPANQPDYNPVRPRKLLLKRVEIDHLRGKLEEKGLTIIPLEIFIKSSYLKMRIGVCKGRKKYDKREFLKKREQKREIAKILKRSR